MPKLVFHSGAYAGKSVSLPPGKSIVLGRNRDVDLPLPDQKLSRRHCQISATDKQCFVRDLSSTNGTYINGERLDPIKEVELQPFDRVVLGDTEIELHSSDPHEKLLAISSDDNLPVPNAAMPPPSSSGRYTPPSGMEAVKPAREGSPLDLALKELQQDLPPEPPPLPPDPEHEKRMNQVLFCDYCHASIPNLQYDLGLARFIGRKLYCKECIDADAPNSPVSVDNTPAQDGKASKVDDILAALEKDAIVIDTSKAPRMTTVERNADAERQKMKQKQKIGSDLMTPPSTHIPEDMRKELLGDEFEEIG